MQDNFNSNSQKGKDDYYNLPLASFTFGKDGDKNIFNFSNPNSSSLKPEEQKQQPSSFHNILNNNSSLINPNNIKRQTPFPSETPKDRDKDKDLYAIPVNIETRRHMQHNKKENQLPSTTTSNSFSYPSTFINQIGSHNSFLSVILHAIYNMKKLRYYLLNDFPEIKDKNSKTKILYFLRNVLYKCTEKNKKIDISQLRNTLSDLFQNRRKFLLDHPDDPCDCYFAFINALHSCYLQFPSNDITDESCRGKCFAHKYLWLDMQRIDECECKGNTKRLLSNFNYIFDIQIDQVIEIAKHVHYGNNNNHHQQQQQQQQNMFNNLYEIHSKLFVYYKMMLMQSKSNCPVNGNRCNINNTHKRLVLNNTPMYLVFALTRSNNNINNDYNLFTSVYDCLKSFILIPQIFQIESVFDLSMNNALKSKRFELLGVVLIKSTKTFTCMFRKVSNSTGNVMWVYYDDDNVIVFHSWFEFIAFCLKSGDMPLMLFYQIEDESKSNIGNNSILSKNEIYLLERYAHNADNVSKIFMNKLRINEEVIPVVQQSYQQNHNDSLKRNNNMSGGGTIKKEYMCYGCKCKNSIDNVICKKCGMNNSDVVKEMLHIRQSNVKYAVDNNNDVIISNNQLQFEQVGNNNESIQKQMLQQQYQYQQEGFAKNQLINPFKVEKKKQQALFPQPQYFINDEQELIITSAESKARKHYDMPRQIIKGKETPVVLKSQNSNHTKHNLHKGNSHNKIESNSRPKTSKIQHQSNQQSNSTRFELSLEIWRCPKCGRANKETSTNCKCKNYIYNLFNIVCKHIRRSESSYDRVHTPNLQHHNQYALEKKNSHKHIERRKSSEKYKAYNTLTETKSKIHDDKKRANIHGIAYGGNTNNINTNNIIYQQRPQTANIMSSKYDNRQTNKISAVNVNMSSNVTGNTKLKSHSVNKKYFN